MAETIKTHTLHITLEILDIIMELPNKSFQSRDEEEVAGYAEVMETIFSSWSAITLTENHIKQLHRDLREPLTRISHQFACCRLKYDCCQYVMIIFPISCHDRLRLMRPRLSFLRQRAHAPSTRRMTMLSVASTRLRKKSGAIFASIGEICGLKIRGSRAAQGGAAIFDHVSD